MSNVEGRGSQRIGDLRSAAIESGRPIIGKVDASGRLTMFFGKTYADKRLSMIVDVLPDSHPLGIQRDVLTRADLVQIIRILAGKEEAPEEWGPSGLRERIERATVRV